MAQSIPVRLLQEDMEAAKSRDAVQRVVVEILREFGLLPSSAVQPKREPLLRIVKSDDESDDG